MRKRVSGIAFGEPVEKRTVGDLITADTLWITYCRVPGCKIIINKMIKAIWHNGFVDFDLDKERMEQLQLAHIYRDIFGYSAVAFSGEDVQAWNPKTAGIGFEMTNFDTDGICTEITIYNSPNIISNQGVPITDFVLLRTPEGLAGPMGISKILDLVDVLRSQHDIYLLYTKYAFHQSLAHPVVKIDELDDTKYDRVNAALSAPTKDDAVIIDMKDDFKYASPMQSAYNPIDMLEYGDTYITRSSELNKLQLYGDPAGVLVASETATANWYATVKEEQDKVLPQILEILTRLGAPEDVQFNDPGEYSIATQMNGVLLIRKALDGLVEKEQIVDMINKLLGLDESEKLEAKEDEPEPEFDESEPQEDEEQEDEKEVKNSWFKKRKKKKEVKEDE